SSTPLRPPATSTLFPYTTLFRSDEAGVVLLDLLERILRPADEVHLVDGDDDMADAQQRDDERVAAGLGHDAVAGVDEDDGELAGDRKSTRLNSSHLVISYAVFCL